MGGCASKDKKDKVVDGDAVATDNNATENNTADGDKATAVTAAGETATTEANGDATANPEGCVYYCTFCFFIFFFILFLWHLSILQNQIFRIAWAGYYV